MSVKSEISQDYTAAQLKEHGSKPINIPPRVLITGASKLKSIGIGIYDRLKPDAVCWNGDVRLQIEPDEFKNFDSLIMCHGVSHLDWMEDAPFEKVKEIFDVNLFGVYNVAQAFVRDTLHNAMRKRIIIIGSMAHRAVLNGSAAYCASKAGVAHLARCLAWELAPKGYDVYTIHPSNTLGTPMSHDTIQGLERYRALSHDDALSYWNDSKIRKRSLTVDEIADLVYFLLYSQTGYLSGAQLELGGGQR